MTRLYGLVGKHLGHSFSQSYHNARFRTLGIEASYANFDLNNPQDIFKLFNDHPNLLGVNVTIPFKQDVIPLLDKLDPAAREVGAVNTIVRDSDLLHGFNTDIYGFRESLRGWLDEKIENALILGTGGSARAVDWVLHSLGIHTTFVSRSPNRGVSYGKLGEADFEKHRLIVNCTPLGMWPNVNASPELPCQFLTPGHWVFDLVYNPEKTLLLKRAAERGARCKNGLEMLHLQADRSWEIWQSTFERER